MSYTKNEWGILATGGYFIMKKKIKNRDIILAMVIVTVVVAAILVIYNVASAKFSTTSSDDSAKITYYEVADSLTNMIQSADLKVEYVESSKRTELYLIGSDTYYDVMYNNKAIYLYEGSYSSSALTDEAKIYEAEEAMRTANPSIYVENVSVFSINKKGEFANGETIEISLTVQQNGETEHNTVSQVVTYSGSEEAATE
jgi:flagellar basal body-associated protein FliL